jgi:hypothetical protein
LCYRFIHVINILGSVLDDHIYLEIFLFLQDFQIYLTIGSQRSFC